MVITCQACNKLKYKLCYGSPGKEVIPHQGDLRVWEIEDSKAKK